VARTAAEWKNQKSPTLGGEGRKEGAGSSYSQNRKKPHERLGVPARCRCEVRCINDLERPLNQIYSRSTEEGHQIGSFAQGEIL